MHIGMLTACHAPIVNGVTQMVALYDKYLTAAGHRVTIFTLGEPLPGEDPGKVIRSPGVPLGHTGYHVAAGYNPVAQKMLQSIDIAHCHHPLMSLEFASRYGPGPVVFTNHTRYDLYLSSYGYVPRSLADQMMGMLWPRLARQADVVIAPSASIRALLQRSGVGVPVEVIENGVELQRFRHVDRPIKREALGIPEGSVVFTYVGRFAKEKDVARLLNEFRIASHRRNDLFLLGVGDGPSLKEVAHMASVYGLSGRTRFVGAVAPERVPAFLALSDVFVSASVTEVHPLAVIEALAAGLPVVAVDSPGMNDIILNNMSGLLVSGQEGSLAWAMSELARDSLLRGQLAAGAAVASVRYDIQDSIRRTVALYSRLIGQHDGPRGQATARIGIFNRSRFRGISSKGRGVNMASDMRRRFSDG